MTIIHQKDKRSGITYAYESTSTWDKEKKQSRSKRHLIGRVDEATGKIVPTDGRNRNAKAKAEQEVGRVTHKYHGATYLLSELAQSTGVTADLRRCFGARTDMILSLAQYFVLEPNNSLYRFAHWQSNHSHQYGNCISSQQSSDLFGSIADTEINNFFRLQGKRRSEGEYWAYDSTSISSYSQTLKQVRYGHNKEHDPLAQINLLMIFGEKSGLPFYYRKLSGSIPDVKTVVKLLDDLDVIGVKNAKLVMDRGFYSKDNLNALLSQHLKFLVGIRTGIKLVQSTIHDNADELRSFRNYDDNTRVYGMTVRTKWSFEQKRPNKGDVIHEPRRVYLHLYCNNERRAEDEQALDQHLGQLYQELQDGRHLEAHAKEYAKYFVVKQTPKRGIQVTPKDDAIQQAKKLCGYWALISNDKMTAQEALHIYRNKDLIEKGFGNIKERLNGRRLLVSSEKSLNGKLFVQFIALILISAINQVMHDQRLYNQYSLQQLLDRLDEVEQFLVKGKAPKVREVQADQTTIYNKFGVKPPDSL